MYFNTIANNILIYYWQPFRSFINRNNLKGLIRWC
jgi:hypothetical protein